MESLVDMCFRNIYKGKKVLITGHTGFKGSWLSIWLHKLGAEVHGYALPPTSNRDNFLTCKLEKLLHHQEGNVNDFESMRRFAEKVQPDIAFHLAAQPLVLLSYKESRDTFETNLMGVVNFFETVKSVPSIKAAVNITSDKCYHNNEWVWGYREADPMGGKDPYSASKGAAELITSSYIHSFFSKFGSCNVASGRAGNVIGGGDWALDRIVPDFFRSLIDKTELSIRNPFATRPWQHVLEPLSGYLCLGAALFDGGKELSGGWNFGPEDSGNYSVDELVSRMIKMSPSVHYSRPEAFNKPYEATFLKLDISKAVNKLAWRPVLSFDDTVQFTVDGYHAELSGNAELLANRMKQITDYVAKASEKSIKWAVS